MIEVCLQSGGVTFEGRNLGTEGEHELVCIDRCLNAVLDGRGRIGKVTAVRRRDCCLFFGQRRAFELLTALRSPASVKER